TLTLRNKLSSIDLVSPTEPAPPPGTRGVLLSAAEIVLTETIVPLQGGGSDALVELPTRGSIAASSEWDLKAQFTLSRAGCVLEENYPTKLVGVEGRIPAGNTSTQKIGFDHDPAVRQFRVRMVAAGNLEAIYPASRTATR